MTISWKTLIWKLGLGLVIATSGTITSSGYNLLAQSIIPDPTATIGKTKKLELQTLKCSKDQKGMAVQVTNQVTGITLSNWGGDVRANTEHKISNGHIYILNAPHTVKIVGLGHYNFETNAPLGLLKINYSGSRQNCTLSSKVFEE